MGQIAVWASALCEGDDLVARADGETVSVLSKGVDSDLGTDVKGPNGRNERALNPLPGPRAETKVDMGDVVFFTERLPALRGTNTAMAAT